MVSDEAVSDEANRIAHNRELWALVNAQFTDEVALGRWQSNTIGWGLFEVPETQLQVLGDVTDLDVIELGCGTAYFSGWLARRGARPVGVDLSPEQLATARRCQLECAIDFPLLEANGESVPLPDDTFDLVISEYGASVWCDPKLWVPEAARLLRQGGKLVFLTNSVLATLCVPEAGGFAEERLHRAQTDIHRLAWPGGGIEFHPTHGEWIEILTANEFKVTALHELHAPDDATPPDYYDIATIGWATRWPVEDLWVAELAD